MIRVLVCGGRKFTDAGRVFQVLDEIDTHRGIAVVIEGGQRTLNSKREIIGGADYWANQWAEVRGREPVRIDAEWTRLGKAAGPIRNQRMIDEGKPDLVVAFPGGVGTMNMVTKARRAGIELIEVDGTNRLSLR